MKLSVKDNTIRIHGEIPVEQWGGFVDACNSLIQKKASGEVPGSDAQPTPRPPAPVLSPGSLLTTAIKLVTGEDPGPNCQCKHRARRMDEWGWLKCWRERRTIAGWLAEEARKRGHDMDDAGAMQFVRAAWKEIRQRRKDEATRTP